MSLTRQSILDSLRQTLPTPTPARDYVSSRAVKNLRVSGADVSFDIELGYPAQTQIDTNPPGGDRPGEIRSRRGQRERQRVHQDRRPRGAAAGREAAAGVKNIIAVASGKGGVGKSTTAVNLALALVAEGARVGMLDADIYGPSQPQMLGIGGESPESHDGKTMEPPGGPRPAGDVHRLPGGCGNPMVWRGPMANQALNQLLKDTNWRDLDYLIIDMPPGTGDIQLDPVADRAGDRCGNRHHAPGYCLLDARKGPQDVRRRSVCDHRHRRKHEHPHLLEVRSRRTHLRHRWRRNHVQGLRRAFPRRAAPGHPDPSGSG